MNIDFESDAIENNNDAPQDNAIKRVTAMCRHMVNTEMTVKALEQQLSDAKAQLDKLQKVEIPELMAELNLSVIGLDDGSLIKIKPDMFVGIKEGSREAAHKWLIDNGFGGLIKTEVITTFGRGELEVAEDYVQKANKAFPDHIAVVVDKVHPSTLKSFCKEQIESGNVDFPKELFGVTQFNRAIYEPPKL